MSFHNEDIDKANLSPRHINLFKSFGVFTRSDAVARAESVLAMASAQFGEKGIEDVRKWVRRSKSARGNNKCK